MPHTTYSELSPVLNLTTGNLVELPLNHPSVIEHGNLSKHKALGDIHLIDGHDYRKVLGLLNPSVDLSLTPLDIRNTDLEKAFFLNYTNKPMCHDYSAMTLAGRSLVWDKLLAKKLNMKEIMRSTKSTSWLWYEDTPKNFLKTRKESIDGLSESQLYKKAVSFIANSWGMNFAGSHKTDNEDYIIIYLGDTLAA